MAVLTRSRFAAAALLAACSLLRPPLAAQQREAGETALKAAFLYNFTKYVEWPAAAFAKQGQFRVCVFADPAFTREIEAILAGERVGSRTVRVIAPDFSEVRSCHLAYFADADRGAQLVAGLRQAPVLTVGEGPRFLEQGGIISFVLEDDRVRFDINRRGVDRAGLTISSKLLRVARHVGGTS
jgi:hypothetical protein